MRLAVWFGLLTGIGEVICLGIQKYLLGKSLFLGPHIIWMAPLADLSLFALLGLLLSALSRRWPRLAQMRIAVSLFAFFGFLSWLLIFPRLQAHAVLLLASGLAVQTARLITPRAPSFQVFITQATRWMLAAVAALMVGTYGWQQFAEARALGQLPPSALGAPNVLLIVLDTVRAQSLSLYGYPRSTTPRLERFAKNGVRFERTLSTAPWTTPAHASLFTGRFPHELSADWDVPLDATHPTLAESLRAHGYATAGFVANTIACGYETGLDRGFLHYEDFQVTLPELIISSSLCRAVIHNPALRRLAGSHQIFARKTASDVNRDFLAWLSRQPRRPFFAFLNYFDAHEPYLPPATFDTQFGAKTVNKSFSVTHRLRLAWRSDREQISPQENQTEINSYDGAIAYLDQQLGLLFDELERRGALANTLVIITADHGEAFGEHGRYTHGDSLYLTLLHVPLLISFPARVPAGASLVEPVSLRDLAATVMDLIELDGASPFPGESLARYWNGARRLDDRASPLLSETNLAPLQPHKFPPGARAEMKSLVLGGYHYIRNHDGCEEVYNIVNDPLELRDAASSEAGRRMIEDSRKFLNTDRSARHAD
jgi:arylsulfatase A-like enzyme